MLKSVCGYCGVGCGIEFSEAKLTGDTQYPVNRGTLCLKGASQLISIKSSNRLLKPQIRENIADGFKESSWQESISAIADKIKNSPKGKVAFYLSGQMLTEDYYIANKLGKGFIGTNNVDTNSRTCMSSAVVGYKKSIGADFVPLRMDDVQKADLLILAGANTAESHVIFHNKIKKAKKNGLKVVVIDPRFSETAKSADIYLGIKAGSDIDFFNLISKRLINEKLYNEEFVQNRINGFEALKKGLETLNKYDMLKRTGLSHEAFEEFFHLYKNSKNIITAWTMGLNQSSQGVDKNLSLINTHLLSGKIFKEGNGPLSLTGQPNAMGGREVGGLATMLGVHLGFDEQSIKKVSEFWNTDKIDNKAGLSATQMMDAGLEVLIICHTDPIYHLPNRNKTQELMKKIALVVEINAYDNSETSKFAHIRLPAAPWGEKEGTQTNLDRTITKQEKLTKRADGVKADWEIFQFLAQELGYKKEFDYKNPKEIFEEYQAMTKLNSYMDISEASYDELSCKPFVWGEKIKNFLTADKKGNLFFVQNRELSEKATQEYPFILLTGRTRDQWHSGTKSANAPSLLKYKELNFCQLHPNDAKELNIKEGEEIKVVSKRGELLTKAAITEGILEKTIFIPISNTEINYLTNDLLDLESFQPDYNHAAVRIVKL
ncbi:MAG: molybdopterin oxidoreductase family protein [Sulfurimonas sp.]|uniref:molybdopterin oxidoreductase family protein n=1 Tax=Sulfurimonas sp. TaxID=2022749 RepID=UPI0028CC067A|nr:molybdopterin oxidoreductase family protein [Sulfurimonas sp.]MDT8338424.1 molybdopterin oxidoreductase family protein [Sulfurimonas sp.]